MKVKDAIIVMFYLFSVLGQNVFVANSAVEAFSTSSVNTSAI
jgi:hypothetical protein